MSPLTALAAVALLALAACDHVWGLTLPAPDAPGPPPSDAGVDAPPPPPDATPTQVTIPIATSTDDTLDDPFGIQTVFGWCTINSPLHSAGLRFAVPGVARGAQIDEAFLEVYVDGTDIDTPAITIQTQASGAPAPFTVVDGDLDNRPRGAAVLAWTGANIGGGWRQSPSVAELVSERVRAADWDPQAGYIVFVLRGAAVNPVEGFEFRQWDHLDASNAPGAFAARLHLTYVNPTR